MTIATTPEILEPGVLQAYDERDFTTVVAGAGPDGQACLRLNQTSTGSETQSLWQPLNTDSHLWPARPAKSSLSFWINRRGTFAGSSITTNQTNSSSIAFPTNGGYVMSMGNANSLTDAAVNGSRIGWGIVASNTDDLYYAVSMRLGGVNNGGMWFVKLADLPLNTWTFIVINAPEANAGLGVSSPTNGASRTFYNGTVATAYSPPHSTSSGGSWVTPQSNIDPTVARFAIGTTSLVASAVKASSNGPICDLAHVAFHNRHLTDFEVLNLYEAMIHGS